MRGAPWSIVPCHSTDTRRVVTMASRVFWKRVAAVAVVAGLAALAVRSRASNISRFKALNKARRPVDKDGIVIGAGPIRLEGSPTHAALLIHGFGDTPQSMRPLAEALHRAGWSVEVMLLPGHARLLEEYSQANALDWLHSVRLKYVEMCDRYETVVVCGISMGAALATILAAENEEIPALVLLAPYLAMPRPVYWQMLLGNLFAYPIPYHSNTGSERSIHDAEARLETLGIGIVTTKLLGELRRVAARARRALPQVRARVLYLQSREDNRLTERDAIRQFARLGSSQKQQRWLTGCGHIITVDYCKDEVARQVIEWFAPLLEPAVQHHTLEN
jgi:carboxylesterase